MIKKIEITKKKKKDQIEVLELKSTIIVIKNILSGLNNVFELVVEKNQQI